MKLISSLMNWTCLVKYALYCWFLFRLFFSCFHYHFLNFFTKASERELIWTIRLGTVVIGTLTAVVAIYVRSIYALWALCTDLIYVILFPQLTCVIYFTSTNMYGSLVAFVVGTVLRLAAGEATLGIDPLIRYPWYQIDENGTVNQLFPHKTFAMLLSMLSLFLVSMVTNRITNKRGGIYEVNQHERLGATIENDSAAVMLLKDRSEEFLMKSSTH